MDGIARAQPPPRCAVLCWCGQGGKVNGAAVLGTQKSDLDRVKEEDPRFKSKPRFSSPPPSVLLYLVMATAGGRAARMERGRGHYLRAFVLVSPNATRGDCPPPPPQPSPTKERGERKEVWSVFVDGVGKV